MKMEKIKMCVRKSEIGRLIFYLFFVLINVNSFAQKISEVRYTYHISDIESKYEIIQLNIRNDTNEKMLLWFEKDTAYQKKAIGDKVKKHFFSVKGDFSLVNLICENGSTLTGFETDMFYTFYKIIEPQKTFTIQVICKNSRNRNIVKLLKEMMVTITPAQMKTERWNVFEFPIEGLSFKPATLVINGVDMLSDRKQ